MSISLVNARLAVTDACNMPATAASGTFVTTSELNRVLNAQCAELHDLVVSRFEDQFTTSLTFTIASGNTYTLAAGFYKLVGLDRDEGTNDWRRVRAFEWNARNRRVTNASWYRSREIRYRVVGTTIQLTPDDAALGTYRLWYVPQWTDLSADVDLIDFPQNWHEYALAGAIAHVLAKEESPNDHWLTQKAQLRARILAMAANRDADRPSAIRDVRRSYDYDYEDP